MADKKDVIYEHEVNRITLKESHMSTNPAKDKFDRRIFEEPDRYFQKQDSSYFKAKTSKLNRSNTSVTRKTNHCIEQHNSQVVYNCDVCDILCTGIDNLMLHCEGKKHKKKLMNQKILPQMGSMTRNIQISTTMNCDTCKKKFTNIESHFLQCKGGAHQEISSLNGFMKTKELENPSQFPENASCTKSSTNHCNVCKIWFKNSMAYNLHLKTSEHYGKGQNVKELVVMRDVDFTSEESKRLTCETGGKSFNGPVPYKQHLMSDYHSKKDDIAKEMAKMNIFRDSELYCKDCGKKFSGIIPLNDHLRGSSHKKQVKKNNLLKNLEEEHLEVLDYSMFGNLGEYVTCGDDVKFRSETCHADFKIFEGVQEHFSGFKKREVTKEKVPVKKSLELITIHQESFIKEDAGRLSESDDSSDVPLIEL